MAVGVAMQVAVVLVAHVPPVQTKEVAAGLHDAVNKDDAPEAINVGDALSVQTGATGVVTVTCVSAAAPVPVWLIPATE